MSNINSKKLTVTSLILMIFTSVYGFANIPKSFYLMGYGAIIWFILSAITFFVPFAFMLAEYGAAFKDEKGGMYSWMEKSVGAKFAFVGTFMWYTSNLIWMVNNAAVMWITISNTFLGKDTTGSWSLFGLNSTRTVGLLSILLIVFVSIIALGGLRKITKITSIGGIAVTAINLVLLLGAIAVLILNGGELAQPITSGMDFIKSPNSDYGSPISMISFIVFAIFSFGGIEIVAGLADQTENAEVTFPKGIAISAIVISVAYAIGIFLCGIFANWNSVLSGNNINLSNACFVLMKNLGYELGVALGLSEATCLVAGVWIARITGLSMFLALSGAFFITVYAPLKQLIEGTPKKLWPGKLGEVKDGIPKNAMKVQAAILIVIIAGVSIGGEGASAFFNKLVLMTNVATTVPYMFITVAFIYFKKKDSIIKPYEFFKTKASAKIVAIVVTAVVGFGNIFTVLEPAVTDNDISSTIWMLLGPVIFTIMALLIYNRYEKIKDKDKNVA